MFFFKLTFHLFELMLRKSSSYQCTIAKTCHRIHKISCRLLFFQFIFMAHIKKKKTNVTKCFTANTENQIHKNARIKHENKMWE